MDKNIVATPIPPDQPEAPQLVVRIAGGCLVAGVLVVVSGSFWPVVGPWLIGAGVVVFIAGFLLLAPYWRPSDHQQKRDIHKLYGNQ